MPEGMGSEKKEPSLNNDQNIKPQLVIPEKEEKKKSFFSKVFKKEKKEEVVKEVKKVVEIKKPEPIITPKEETKDPFALPSAGEAKFHEPKPLMRAKFLGGDDDVDLIPAAAKIRNWNQILNLLFTAFLTSFFVIIVFYFSLLIFERGLNIKQEITSQEISNIEEKLLTFESWNEEVEDLGQQIASVYSLLNKHIYWTNFFELLEKYTLADVHYSGFSAGQGGNLTLNALASDFDSVSKQLKILESSEDFLTDIRISSASLSEAGVSFSIALTLDPDLFYYQEN